MTLALSATRCATLVFLWVSAGLASAQNMQEEHFKRVLDKLDHAPVSFENMGPAAARGSAMSQMASDATGQIEKAAPTLKAVGESHLLGLASKLPGIGEPAEIAKETLLSATEIASGMRYLVDADKAWVEPLRQAVTAADTLRKSRNRKDLERARVSLRIAVSPLERCVDLCKSYSQHATDSADLVVKLQTLFSDAKTPNPNASELGTSMRKLASSLSLMGLEFAALAQYTKDCANEADLASGTPGPVSTGHVADTLTPGSNVSSKGTPSETSTGSGSPTDLVPTPNDSPARNADGGNTDFASTATAIRSERAESALPVLLVLIGATATAVMGALLVHTYRRSSGPAAPPEARIEIVGAAGAMHSHRLGRSVIIGRDPSATIQIDDSRASALHASIERVGNRYRLFDLDTSNGTQLNGTRISEADLRSGDVIEIGGTRIHYRQGSA